MGRMTKDRLYWRDGVLRPEYDALTPLALKLLLVLDGQQGARFESVSLENDALLIMLNRTGFDCAKVDMYRARRELVDKGLVTMEREGTRAVYNVKRRWD